MQWVIDVTTAHAPLDRRYRMDASWQLLLPVITTTAVCREAEDTACHHYDRVVRRGVAPQSMTNEEHRVIRQYKPSLRQRVVCHGIAPQGMRQHKETSFMQ